MTTDISQLVLEGLYLMLVGMSFVLGFLTLVVIALNLLAKFAHEPATIPASPLDAIKSDKPDDVSDKTLLAVISAAIHQYRNDQFTDKQNTDK